MEADPGAYHPHCWFQPLLHSPAPPAPDLHSHEETHFIFSMYFANIPALHLSLTSTAHCVCVCDFVLTGFILVIVNVNIIGLHHHETFSHQPGWSKSEPHGV